MTRTVGAYEAKTHLPRILDEVEAGDDYVITKHGRPVARLVPVVEKPAADELLAEFADLRAGRRLGISVRKARAEGRR